MKLQEHEERTLKLAGIRATDIHKWIDGFFDAEGFTRFLFTGRTPGYDPYDHRKHRHCTEALQEAYKEFEGKYTREQIKMVFESHIKDDYNGYIPTREDFANGTFKEKFHESADRVLSETILSRDELSEYFAGKHYERETAGLKGFILQIVLPTIATIALFITAIFVVILPFFRNSMMERKRETIRELTSAAASSIYYFIQQEQSGTLDRASAQKLAAAEVDKMRYGVDNKDYFWITDMSPRMITHPYRQELIGRDLSNYRDSEDPAGQRLFVEFVRLVEENGDGYLHYRWQWMDDSTRTVPKLSYVRGIPEWQWIVGTGIYIHDVEEELSRLTHRLLLVFFFITTGLSVLLSVVVLQSHKIEKKRRRAQDGLLEAKDRYRALVEASNEGFILVVDGKIVFSNNTIQRLTGKSDEQLAGKSLKELLPADLPENGPVLKHLKDLLNGKSGGAQFEARLMGADQKPENVFVTTSKIFLSEKIGFIISFRKIAREPVVLSLESHENRWTAGSYLETQVRDVMSDPTKNRHAPAVSETATILEAVLQLAKSSQGILRVLNKNGKTTGQVTWREIAWKSAGLPIGMILDIESSTNSAGVIDTLNRLPNLVSQLNNEGAKVSTLRDIIGRIYDAAVSALCRISIDELGAPPVDFCFVSLGSNARREMTMFSDQDNALIYEDSTFLPKDIFEKYFSRLSQRVCSKLDQTGFSYCPGGIMAVNPKWCMPLSAWQKQFERWIADPNPDALLQINVFCDIRPSFGNNMLAENLRQHVLDTAGRSPEFFLHYARNCLLYKPPLNLFGQLPTGILDAVRAVNIKQCLKPIETFARIYALKYGIQEPSTEQRLEKLADIGILQDTALDEIKQIFDYLWKIRFYNQLVLHKDLRKIDDELDIDKLSAQQRQQLRKTLTTISSFQTRLSYHFLGVNLNA
ncbi:cache domain-containing protein [candidate division KSB1 bacterium]|nr:cache domain-containing protein [candidate division KSB1 bacterium]